LFNRSFESAKVKKMSIVQKKIDITLKIKTAFIS